MPVANMAALPQDPSSPSGRPTVISMVKNKNNLEDLRLRRKLEEYNKELVFRVKTHDFEKLDTYEFLKHLKDCGSDNLSQFKELQQTIRDMPTPNSVSLQSLNLHISGYSAVSAHLPVYPNVKNSYSTPSRYHPATARKSANEGHKLPVIFRSQTEPAIPYHLRVKKQFNRKLPPKQAWGQPSLSANSNHVKTPTRSAKIVNTKQVVQKNKRISNRNNVQESHFPVTKSNVLMNNCNKETMQSVVDEADLCGNDNPSDRLIIPPTENKINVNSEILYEQGSANKPCLGSGNGQGANLMTESETHTNDSVESLKGFPLSKGYDANQNQLSKSLDSMKYIHSGDISKQSCCSSVSLQLSYPNLSSSSTNRKQLISRYSSKPPQKLSLPTLLSLGIGTLKDPTEFQYSGIMYASNSAKGKARNKDIVKSHKSYKASRKTPVEVRMQNLFGEVDKLVEKSDEGSTVWTF